MNSPDSAKERCPNCGNTKAIPELVEGGGFAVCNHAFHDGQEPRKTPESSSRMGVTEYSVEGPAYMTISTGPCSTAPLPQPTAPPETQAFVDAVNKSRPEWNKLRVAQTIEAEQWIVQNEPMSGWTVGRFLQTMREEGQTDALTETLTAFSAHQNSELTRELALWKRSMCVLYELIEDTPCPHPHAAIGLVTSSVDKLRQRLASLREELERMKGKR
jgi:hypothetical protein